MKRLLAAIGLVAMASAVSAVPAAADPVGAASASAYGATISLGGSEAVPPTPLAEIALPPGGEASETVIDVPAEPVAVSGTLNADATAHAASDVPSALTVEAQEVEGPYNATAVALIEGADVLLDAAGPGVSLLSADVIRAEAAAVCRAGSVHYTANSEIVDLQIGGEQIPLNAPVSELIDTIAGVLDDSGLNAVVDVDRNVVTELDGGGIAVDALVVEIAEAGGPLALVTIGHAEVRGTTCGTAATTQCSDGVDNADPEDTVADADDPGCHTDGNAGNADSYDPNDDDETDGAKPECSDAVDNADPEDTVADAADPGCHTDGNAANASTYDPNDDDETDAGSGALAGTLPRTGGEVAIPIAAGLGGLAAALQALRRRMTA